eukprot:CAMPEP_0185573852 /NCGR_PEP_ID=MMETSP0434-20130131/5447_1 /TAXON_ID=626734 ORGANISM="Favella taraikaensis, Strain Fe Narragansett Bay" /NCGR_SAMPLE_ID=MMETSP0434 /ASSEMBLY_ACC=CAM_ASM_000379 /LENGTH=94 /DNA_ID=CAMNT_0028190213 /DNA_START=891 /DNA_END=1174 /DNA_ORIENTATION=-
MLFDALNALLAREAEVYAVFHHEKALLALGALQSLQQGAVDLRHGPGLELPGAALLVNEGVAQFGADGDVGVAELLQADLVHLAVVLDQLAHDL